MAPAYELTLMYTYLEKMAGFLHLIIYPEIILRFGL